MWITSARTIISLNMMHIKGRFTLKESFDPDYEVQNWDKIETKSEPNWSKPSSHWTDTLHHLAGNLLNHWFEGTVTIEL